ncbi:flagellar rod assembly protein FlgJ [Photobacterium kishitanii]|uniref:Peptidoglycan hydrolase FlgJ n=1 Tax=Photobacterium kishitanii TaxID=318456 RepID=A0AAX0Z011_9GAMM|nr:flagellar assembly peptidoglycan hydrolase FlgJ [Photobacterium kishitanii]KJG61180.1 flagellar rod assembly protein FlgJ [Photobacterium kishitanii]KJG65372.1 flagellar rod assembly protein FlgJ [Photobacterium kishitanii]KJG69478.1 flagellar rod assembly protein FlgJ [Photobacterium kishitanii]PSX21488.1 flagellar assembly peptidoglycan hydrolase FlgJ [Photobacterium kishitanii]PSX30290.1 flagellar assembly peptidoglycan hydrolase FlgJ [Photobacterium kishitanii]
MKQIEPGFIHDLSNLDRLRAGISEDKQGSLREAATQFESIFTQMLFKSMREANSAFESDLMSSNNSKFYQQMHDEQISSQLSTTGSLGLADMIVKQLGGEPQDLSQHQPTTDLSPQQPSQPFSIRPINADSVALPTKMKSQPSAPLSAPPLLEKVAPVAAAETLPTKQLQPTSFASAEAFVSHMKPYAQQAARALGTDPALLIAQAALETGWGKKVISNTLGSSNNLFNIKADPRWQGQKVATKTLEFHDGIAVQEQATFRSYDSYQHSFDDFVNFLQHNPRYSKALTHSNQPQQFIREIHQAGYATDPNYSNKVLAVMKKVQSLL